MIENGVLELVNSFGGEERSVELGDVLIGGPPAVHRAHPHRVEMSEY